MKQSIRTKLNCIAERVEELGMLLSQPDVINDVPKFRQLAKEHAKQLPIADTYNQFLKMEEDLHEAEIMQKNSDAELAQLVKEEVLKLKQNIADHQNKLQTLLLPQDPNDNANVFLEIRAGAGGDEAAIFCGDLYRMYHKYAEQQGWKIELINSQEGDHGGFKEIIIRIEGKNVYSNLKFESGAHRVQRIPETESQGRVHTSASTVVVLPELPNLEEVIINKADIREDSFRASGAGGQHVNKTDSAIRLTHLPTKIVVECQDERSQHKNRARAYSLLTTKLNDLQEQARQKEEASERKSLVGTGDRSDRIRTYNFPQGRITDHRINLTLYKLDEVIEGNLACVIEPLIREHQANLLASQNEH